MVGGGVFDVFIIVIVISSRFFSRFIIFRRFFFLSRRVRGFLASRAQPGNREDAKLVQFELFLKRGRDFVGPPAALETPNPGPGQTNKRR